jgi:IclR family transcriptional regulator, KDG regulon repressor
VTHTEHVPYTEHQTRKPPRPAAEAPALDRGLAILELLDTTPKGLNLTEISKAIGSPKNSTSRLIQTLIGRAYLTRDEDTQRFLLTSKLLRLGQPRPANQSLVECALPAMRALRDATRETIQLGISIGDEGVIIEKSESTQAMRIGVDIGLRFLLHNNAPGKVLLAFLPAKERDRAFQRLKLERFTDRTITDRDALRKECERIVQQGYATDFGEADEGIHCIAAPIFSKPQELCATIWVSAPARRMPKAKFAEVGDAVMHAAREIESRLSL